MSDIEARARRIRLVILDVDGVLTDGRLYYGEHDEHFRAFHVRDGLGIKLLIEYGIVVAIISGRHSRSLSTRLEPLGVQYIYQGREDKQPAFAELLSKVSCSAEETAYMGDDLQDLAVMARVGLAATVADAHPMVAARAHWTSTAAGGRGAVRELSEFILSKQGKMTAILRDRFALGPAEV